MNRINVAALSFTAIGLIGLVTHEDWMPVASVPTKNDRCTNGFGSTFKEDGSPVICGEKIEPVAALKRTVAHIQKSESGLKQCVTGALNQTEYDVLVDFAYQYGVAATCKSSMVRDINAGEYEAACHAYALYKRAGGRDCSLPENWGPKGCKGVWTRNLERQAKCLAAQ